MAATTSLPIEHPLAEKPPLRDFRQEVTDSIVAMLERGVAPWQKPWEPGASSLGMPFNPTSERAYRGGNAIHLMATGLQRGYEDPRWMTYKQAADNGWQVSRGEKGTQIEYWDVKQASDKTQPFLPNGGGDAANGNNSNGTRLRRTIDSPRWCDGPRRCRRWAASISSRQAGFRIVGKDGVGRILGVPSPVAARADRISRAHKV